MLQKRHLHHDPLSRATPDPETIFDEMPQSNIMITAENNAQYTSTTGEVFQTDSQFIKGNDLRKSSPSLAGS